MMYALGANPIDDHAILITQVQLRLAHHKIYRNFIQ
jgi:hypothetical protein